MPVGRQADFERLRGQYPFLEYHSYEVRSEKSGIRFGYTFNLSDKIVFRPTLLFNQHGLFSSIDTQLLHNLAFHIGMIELISYWKASCPPQIIVQPHSLSEKQVQFWKSLYWNGLGEFFHINGIDTNAQDFVEIIASEGSVPQKSQIQTSEARVIVPVGGGKDSAVSLELLKNTGHEVIPFMLNPNPAMLRTIHAAGIETNNALRVNRSLDPQLLELNAKGYLNGHTPFSALLAFVGATAAALTLSKHIALSNESSANEVTIPGTHINHQYSKSLHFEKSFRDYLQHFITADINYFSFLRPLNELQIAWLFSRMPQYHSAFLSCNAGSKSDSWCTNCPKCLFTYTILSPFMKRSALLRIFGKDLFDDNRLLGMLGSLAGLTDEKPFECVGTVNEVQAAIDYVIHRNQEPQQSLPKLVEQKIRPPVSLDFLLHDFDVNHCLTAHFETLLRDSLNE